MRKALPWLSLGISAIPLVLEQPYCLRAMGTSPAERWNWCFLLGAVVLAVGAAGGLRRMSAAVGAVRPSGSPKWWCLALLVVPLGVVVFAQIRQIHLAMLMAGLTLLFGVGCGGFGWRKCVRFLPAAAMLALFFPCVGMLLAMLLRVDGLVAKALLAVGLVAVSLLWLVRPQSVPGPTSMVFALAAIAVACVYLVQRHSIAVNPPLQPDFMGLAAEGFHGVRETESEADRRFFGNSRIERFFLQSQAGQSISVLAVGNLDNVHQIHPGAYCLRVSGYQLCREQAWRLPAGGNTQGAEVLEMLGERNGRQCLFWQWFSSERRSTANFLLFRSLYSASEGWMAYVLGAEVKGSVEDCRASLVRLLQAFPPRTPAPNAFLPEKTTGGSNCGY